MLCVTVVLILTVELSVVYEQVRTITRLINLEARRKCFKMAGWLKLGEKVMCALHTAVCTCMGHRDLCAAPGQPLGTHCVTEDVVGIHRGACRLKGEIKAWLQVEL